MMLELLIIFVAGIDLGIVATEILDGTALAMDYVCLVAAPVASCWAGSHVMGRA